MDVHNIAVSRCSNPTFSLERALQVYSGLGYRKFEAFTSGALSALDFRKPAQGA